jgi:hypothetical protein
MSIPPLPVKVSIDTVTATKNGETGWAEPYLLTVFFKVDGQGAELFQRSDGKLVLHGEPRVRPSASRHGNLPRVRDGQTVDVPGNVGETPFSLRPIALPPPLGDAVVGGAPGVAGVVFVLAEEDAVSDTALRAGYEALVDQLGSELKDVLESVVVDPAAPGANPFSISQEVKDEITARITERVKKAIFANSTLIQKAKLLDKDDIIGTDVVLFSESDLLGVPVRTFRRRFDVGARGDWTLEGGFRAEVPADLRRRRRVTFDLVSLTCVIPTEGGLQGGDQPYMWNVFFTIDGASVAFGEDLRLRGRARVQASVGSHGNLGAGAAAMRAGDRVEIPDPVGRFVADLRLIPFPAALESALVGGVSGVAGCVSVLLEKDLVAPAAAEEGRKAFVDEVTRVLDELIPTLGVGSQTPDPADLEALGDRIGQRVREEILAAGGPVQDLLAALDPDDVIGFRVLLFTHADLIRRPHQPIAITYDDVGRYTAEGSVTAAKI